MIRSGAKTLYDDSTDESQASQSDEQMMTMSLQPETEKVHTVTEQTYPRQLFAVM